MRWEAGRASDVVHKILEQFRSTFKEFTTRIDVVLGAEHVKLSVDKKSLEWIGQKSKEIEGFYVADGGAGKTECFDEIVVATGFGLETVPAGHANTSYWRNEQASQPILGSSPSRILISGYGDGALTDLFRLTIERFRQETILREIFKDQKQLQIAELKLRRVKASNYSADQLFSAFENELDELDNVSEQLAHRLRKDTKVYLHLSGPSNKNTSLVDAFGRTSSFLNRFMLFLLYRCGAFVPVFGELDSCIAALNISPRHVLCRHGTSTKDDFKSLLSGGHLDYYMASLEKIRAAQMQGPQPWFEPGFFQPEKWKKS